MRKRFYTLFRIFITVLLLFLAAKLFFIAYHHTYLKSGSIADVPAILWHGLPLDLATTGYLTAIPWLLLAVSVWAPHWQKILRKFYLIYAAVIAVLLSVILVADTCLYSFWEFKLDATVFNYLDSPQGVTQSVTPLYLLTAAVVIIAVAFGLFKALLWTWPNTELGYCRKRIGTTALLVVAGGMLFLMIRGGVGRSTANIGMVYYSDRAFCNHAAVNPAFSLFYSAGKMQDFSEQCNYFDETQRASLFAHLAKPADTQVPQLLNTTHPNVVIILMEGFGGTFVGPLGARADITPRFNQLCSEGIFFTQCYANSFRTDRGTVSVLSGYPAFPTASVMKLPEKTRHLPGIAASLQQAGYDTEFLYGGDINFTNMNSYFMSTGYQKTYGDTDFPLEQRRTHAWGVTDRITFGRLYDMILSRRSARQPWHIGFLTLASHEPWKVPYHRIPNDEKANAMAYLDDCLGQLVDKLKRTPMWKNLLIICLPDHGIVYPQDMNENNIAMSHIPMLWIGGAVKAPAQINTICNQSDLAATLLGQLRLPHNNYRFSRNVLSKSYTYPFAMHTWAGGFCYVDSTGHTIFDLSSEKVTAESPQPSSQRLNYGKAYLQTCYDDLGNL